MKFWLSMNEILGSLNHLDLWGCEKCSPLGQVLQLFVDPLDANMSHVICVIFVFFVKRPQSLKIGTLKTLAS